MAADRDRSPSVSTRPRRLPRDGLDRLRARVRAIEGGARAAFCGIPLGIPEIDARLPDGGIAPAALHQIFPGDATAGAATAFAAALLARLMRQRPGMVLWCLRPRIIDIGEIYGPGLIRFGLDPARLVVVRARRDSEALWTVEEALRCRDLVAVLGETGPIGLTASRRLQLAAETGAVTALLLHPAGAATGPSAAATCWRIAASPSLPRGIAAETGEPGPERWQTELVRCRGGRAGAWLLEWCDETGDLALSAPLRDRPDRQRRAAAPA